MQYLGLLDMIDGGGAGRAGDSFEGGGLLSEIGNLLFKPRGFRDRQQAAPPSPQRPMPRPQPTPAAPPVAPLGYNRETSAEWLAQPFPVQQPQTWSRPGAEVAIAEYLRALGYAVPRGWM